MMNIALPTFANSVGKVSVLNTLPALPTMLTSIVHVS